MEVEDKKTAFLIYQTKAKAQHILDSHFLHQEEQVTALLSSIIKEAVFAY